MSLHVKKSTARMNVINHFLCFSSNQSARELSHFAESAMAVKRVILQQFSMRLNYLNKERSNIYQPSVKVNADDKILVDQDRSEMDELIDNSSSSTISPHSPPTDDDEGQLMFASQYEKAVTGSTVKAVKSGDAAANCDIYENTKNILTSALDNLAELNEKLPETSDKRGDNIAPEENWRYRSGADNNTYYPFNYKNQGRNNVHFEGSIKYGKSEKFEKFDKFENSKIGAMAVPIRRKISDIGFRSCVGRNFGSFGNYGNLGHLGKLNNWRNECVVAPSTSSNTSIADNQENTIIGLSPPNESLLMKRRLGRQSLSAKYFEGNNNTSINTIQSLKLQKLQPMTTCSS